MRGDDRSLLPVFEYMLPVAQSTKTNVTSFHEFDDYEVRRIKGVKDICIYIKHYDTLLHCGRSWHTCRQAQVGDIHCL